MRDYYLLTGLARRHSVRLLCMVRSEEEASRAAPLAETVPFAAVPLPRHTAPRRLAVLLASRRPDLAWRTESRRFWGLLWAELKSHPPDIVLVEGLEMVQYGLWVRGGSWRLASDQSWQQILRGRTALVLDEHNAEYLLQQRAWEIGRQEGRSPLAALYSRLQAGRLAHLEARACLAAEQVVAVSEADRRALLAIAPQARIAVVPNGVDAAAYAPLPPPPEGRPPTLVFTGRMDFRPNVDAVQWFCAEIWPRIREEVPAVRFQVVGRDPTPAVQALATEPGVEVIGAVPDDRPYIGQADLYVLPMRFGGGIRFKLLQALSMERAVVSTSLGADGVVELVPGEHLLLADAPAAFARQVVECLRRPELRQRLGRAGRELVAAHYDWQVLLPRFEAALAEVVPGEV